MANPSKMPKHGKAFALAYINSDRNASEAARSLPGVSEKSAGEIGSRLLKNVEVQKEIKRLEKKLEDKFTVSKEKIIKRHAEIAFSDPSDVMTWTESGIDMIPSRKLNKAKRGLIRSLSHTTTATGESFKCEMQSQQESLRELSKLLGYYPDQKIQLPGSGGVILITNVKDE